MHGHGTKLCTQPANRVYPKSTLRHVINDTRPSPLFFSLASLHNMHEAWERGYSYHKLIPSQICAIREACRVLKNNTTMYRNVYTVN